MLGVAKEHICRAHSSESHCLRQMRAQKSRQNKGLPEFSGLQRQAIQESRTSNNSNTNKLYIKIILLELSTSCLAKRKT